MPSYIPASALVQISPSVIGASGSALSMTALVLTTSTRIPIGSTLSYPTAAAVSNAFGPTSDEAIFAGIYFQGFDNSNVKPGVITFAQYPMAAVGAYVLGAPLTQSLTQLQALSGSLSFVVNGSTYTAGSISFAGATSFSNAAAMIQASFSGIGCTFTYDSVGGGFVVTNGTTGTSSTITFATGSLAATLGLTQATGAQISQGAPATTPAAFMTNITQVFTNFATLATIFNPDQGSGNAQKLAFSTWVSQQNDRYMYVCWDGDVTATLSTQATASLGYLLRQSQQSGTFLQWGPDYTKAAFICGAVASIDFNEKNGSATLAFKAQAGLTADVTSQTAWQNLKANGYNCYSAFASGANFWVGESFGFVSGPFKWADAYVNQIYFNNALQTALVSLLFSAKSLPYDPIGYNETRAACMDPINQMLNFGGISVGQSLSAAEASAVNTAAGVKIDQILTQQGVYLQILDATQQVRSNRGSFPIFVWYCYAGSVQQLALASIEVS